MYYFLDIYKPFFSKNNTYCVANNIYNIYKTFANPMRLERDEFNKPFHYSLLALAIITTLPCFNTLVTDLHE